MVISGANFIKSKINGVPNNKFRRRKIKENINI